MSTSEKAGGILGLLFKFIGLPIFFILVFCKIAGFGVLNWWQVFSPWLTLILAYCVVCIILILSKLMGADID